MRFRYSSFGQKALQSFGVGELMENMGQAMNTQPDLLMRKNETIEAGLKTALKKSTGLIIRGKKV
jgi:hypothetical protein